MAPLPHLSLRDTISSLSARHSSSSSLQAISAFVKRQTAIIPTGYSNQNGPSPGTVVGITLGSIGGFLFILWLLYTIFGDGSAIFITTTSSSSSSASVVVREHRRKSRHSSSGRGSHREKVEIRRERVPIPVPMPVPVVERVTVEERRTERRTGGDARSESSSSTDEVVVIEEHSPPRRSKSGYRTVDPMAYGGGDAPLREVDRKGSRRKSRQ